MTQVLWHVVCLAGVTWLSVLMASLIRAKGWTFPGLVYAMGNRDNPPPATALAGRADRTAKNNLENFVLFLALAMVTHVANANPERATLGADIFFWSRLAFVVVYYAGIPYLRTLVWTAGSVGLVIMASALL
jgi:uncharacterized MAPEG superfamily protein